ncbi:signal transduction histidine kinase [Saccharomonospora amisosensis]|uniref:histidine kinase n=1 Tax=Saccharomonospora amisosensis TaxID=1128677 RepID=A0A7X5UN91_9PSEU|nr:HAMP domain-containing sensor histidine kinase [Saccharomonospora amisosensis]NIJ10852.1 signal transduction histidine kinase [Saccharomonospora amisosensis]
MPNGYFRQLWASGPGAAGRQAGLLFTLAAAATALGVLVYTEQTLLLASIAGANLFCGLLAWSMPWQRWGELWPAVLVLPAFALIAMATLGMGSYAAVAAPFLLLVFIWLGLHFPYWVTLVAAPLGTVAYLVPLILAERPTVVVSTVFVMIPVIVGVALLVTSQVGYLNQAQEELRRTGQWREALTTTLAHDVRSPITALDLALDALEAGELSPQRRHAMVDIARRQTRRLNRLAGSLLDLSRVEAGGELKLELADVPLAEAVADALGYFSERNDIVVDVDPRLRVRVDPERFEQIIHNLTQNALHHAGPPVHIAARAEGDRVRVEVRDFGPGVPDELVSQLFDRFVTGDAARSSGLGLWIVRQLCEAQDGDVHYEPTEDGAAFVVTLPAGQRGRAGQLHDAGKPG